MGELAFDGSVSMRDVEKAIGSAISGKMKMLYSGTIVFPAKQGSTQLFTLTDNLENYDAIFMGGLARDINGSGNQVSILCKNNANQQIIPLTVDVFGIYFKNGYTNSTNPNDQGNYSAYYYRNGYPPFSSLCLSGNKLSVSLYSTPNVDVNFTLRIMGLKF